VLLFSHGFLLDHEVWAPQVESLAPDVRCITYDERGHGMSECRGTYTMWDLADDCIGLLDHQGVEKAVLVGHSQGGFVSLRAALRYPSRVSGLILLDTASGPPPASTTEMLRQMADVWCERGPVGDVATGMVAGQVGPDVGSPTWKAKWQARPPACWRDPWRSVIDGHDEIGERLHEVNCKALVIFGTLDAGFATSSEELGAKLKGDVVPIEGAYHAPGVTHPIPVTQAIEGFLEGMAGES
jgi:3-oxoadipate enol-lactonase